MPPKITRLVQKNALRVLPLASLSADPSYQRDVVAKHKKIVADFDPKALGIPLVAERADGTLWIVDGLQRVTALRKLGKTEVRAEVFASSGPEMEAGVFRTVNKNRTQLTPSQLFHAALTEGDPAAWEVKNTVEACGFVMNRGGARGRASSNETLAKTVQCYGALVKIHRKGGDAALTFVLQTIAQCWPDDPMRLRDLIPLGLAEFYANHAGNVDAERLVPRLNTTTPAKLLYSAGLGVDGYAANVATVIERLYRKRAAK